MTRSDKQDAIVFATIVIGVLVTGVLFILELPNIIERSERMAAIEACEEYNECRGEK